MKKYIFLLRISKTPLSPALLEKRTKLWGQLVKSLTEQGNFIDGQIFEESGWYVSGSPDRIVADQPVIEQEQLLGGILIIEANDIKHAIEISKLCPTIDFGGSVEVRALKPTHTSPKNDN